MKVELSRDWTEFLSALISHRVRFVIVGGHAVAGHGEPRLTEDLDVFVERSPTNARRIRDVLVSFGFGNVAPTPTELARPHKIFMLGRKPWRIDILQHRWCQLRAGLEDACQSRVRSRTALRDRTGHARQEQASRRSRQRPRRCCDARTARPDQEAETNDKGPAPITNRSPAFSARIPIPEAIRYLKSLNFQGASEIAL